MPRKRKKRAPVASRKYHVEGYRVGIEPNDPVTGYPTYGQTYCGRITDGRNAEPGIKLYEPGSFSGPHLEEHEICKICLRRSEESWRDAMNDIFEHGGSDEEREAFEPMGIGNWD